MRKGRKSGNKTSTSNGHVKDPLLTDLRRITGRKSIHISPEEEKQMPPHGDVEMNVLDSPKRSRRKRGKRRGSTEEKEKKLLKDQQDAIVLWRSPFRTVFYFLLECFQLLVEYSHKLLSNLTLVIPLFLLLTALYVATLLQGPHQKYLEAIRKEALWCGYWVGLGILSSVGLGTGLHTFLLYLGPHIARVTLAAYECGSTNFLEPPYPAEIECPEDGSSSLPITLWTIMTKVRIEAMMWGAGTAIGELPPYFMARAARLSGKAIEDDDFEELEELLEEKKTSGASLSLFDRAKIGVHSLIQRVGFFGILACASIPNPLFDLAGITCGHFLVPFWTFFGATLIGKAVIKMHIQQVFVILLFTQQTVQFLIHHISKVPFLGAKFQEPIKTFLETQKNKFHKPSEGAGPQKESILGWILEKFVLLMVVYFVVSIVNSMAQSYHKRKSEKIKEKS